MLILIGLGNPGPRYAKHRHNIGFMAVDAIADRHNFGPSRMRFQGETREGILAGEKVIALKPMTYMNESGRAAGEAMRFYKLAPADLVVFHDELDLPPGKLRMKTGGGHGGHNGLRSLTDHLGADFRRARLGIGHPGHKDAVTPWVLGDFAKADAGWLSELLDAVAAQAPALAEGRDALFGTRVHLAMDRATGPASNPT